MIAKELAPIIAERIRICNEVPEWDDGTQNCYNKMLRILSANLQSTISYILNECSDEEYFWIAEIFDDLSAKLQSKELVLAMRRRLLNTKREIINNTKFKANFMQKHFDYDDFVTSVEVDLLYAEGALNGAEYQAYVKYLQELGLTPFVSD